METTPIPPVLNPPELEALLLGRSDVRLLDVRTPGEYEAVHIHGAYNIPLDTLGEHAVHGSPTTAPPPATWTPWWRR